MHFFKFQVLLLLDIRNDRQISLCCNYKKEGSFNKKGKDTGAGGGRKQNKLTKYYEKYKSTILRAELIMLYANVLIILCFIYRSTTTTGNQQKPG